MPSAPRASGSASRRVAFPRERRLVLDTLALGARRRMMHGLLEVDVTRARALLRAHRERTGEALSFTAFVLGCLGRAVAAHPEVHALRDWAGRLVLFEAVDVTVLVEVQVEGRPFALAHVVRDAHRRPLRELHAELRAVQAGGVGAGQRRGFGALLLLPGPLRRLLFRALLRSPARAKAQAGTVLLSAVGMFGGGVGWGLSAPGLHGLSVIVGGIAPRPAPDGAPGREVLCLTVSADHALVDGAPLARFVHALRTLLEEAHGVEAALSPPG